MIKSQKRTMGVIVILLMLGASPLSVTYSFADIKDNQEDEKGKNNPEVSKSAQKERLGAILTEKVVNGKLEVHHYTLPDDVTEEDMQRMLSLDDQTSGWAYVNYKVYHSGIILFDGKASKVGENLWEISSKEVSNLGEKQPNMKLTGKANDSRLMVHETAADEDLNYRVIFSGKIAETEEENEVIVSLMNPNLKNSEIVQNIKFLHIGELAINSEKSIDSNQEFRTSILMR